MGAGDECIYEGRPRQFRRTREHGRLESGVGRWDKAEISASTSPRSVDTGTADARFPIVLYSDCAPPTLVRSLFFLRFSPRRLPFSPPDQLVAGKSVLALHVAQLNVPASPHSFRVVLRTCLCDSSSALPPIHHGHK